MGLLNVLFHGRKRESEVREDTSEQSKTARELRSEEEVFSADMIAMYDSDPKWDVGSRVAAARAFLRRGWSQADVEDVYGRDVTAAAEQSLLQAEEQK